MDIIQLTRELGKALQQDQRYISYSAAKKANDDDEGLQKKISEFHSVQMESRALSQAGGDRDEIQKLNTRLTALYNEITANPNMIAFDISDSVAEMAEEKLQYVVNEFYDLGIRLYLGNYGRNPSGITLEIMEKFDGVIMSAWRFLDPEMVKHGDIIMKARTDMLTELGKKILIGGVDNRAYFERIMDVSGDYISGAYMSEPITKDELKNKLWDYDKVILE